MRPSWAARPFAASPPNSLGRRQLNDAGWMLLGDERAVEYRPCGHCGCPEGQEDVTSADPPESRRSEAKRTQDRRRRQRIRINGAVERFTADEIGERDGWVCGLCEGPVERAYRHPDPRSPSIDHVRTIASGGTDTRDNVRLTHWGCNHGRNDSSPLTTVEEAESRRAVLLRVPALRPYAEGLTAEGLIRGSQAFHSPERYRAKLARRVERYEREGR